MEALVPGKPLSFLDHHIQCGNSLLGTMPALLANGIPGDAFQPIEGDDKAVCRAYKRQNQDERRGQADLFDSNMPWNRLGDLTGAMQGLEQETDDTVAGVHRKQERYADLVRSSGYLFGRLWADAWCAAFVWRKDRTYDFPITERIYRQIEASPHHLTPWMRDEIQRLATQYGFFHWHLAFPDVFRVPGPGEKPANEATGWNGGFDVVVGNPPWERIKLQEQEWFAERRPDIADARNAAERRRMIAALAEQDPALHRAFLNDRRTAEGESHFVRNSGRYPLCGRGDVNTYTLFAETNRMLINPTGRVGCIVPSGIATDDTTKVFFQDLMQRRTLVSLFSFFEIRLLFPDTDSRNPFCLLTLTGPERPIQRGALFVFDARNTEELSDSNRRFTLSPSELDLLNPNTRTCPVFRSQADAELTKAIYHRTPILLKKVKPSINPWGVRFTTMLHMANDSNLFRTARQLEADGWRLHANVFHKGQEKCVPLYEAKLAHYFDHRWASYDGSSPRAMTEAEKTNAAYLAMPRYWINATEVEDRLRGRWDHHWLLGWRDITRNNDERTVIASLLPYAGVGHTEPLILPNADPAATAALYANLTTFAFDYVARQKIGGTHVTFGLLEQLPLIPPEVCNKPARWSPEQSVVQWLLPRVVELTYTAWDLQPFAQDCGFDGPPFRWDAERRFLLRCELDAPFFYLYGVDRSSAEYMLDTFSLVKEKDIERHGEYRTKRVVLDIFNALAEAVRTSRPYQTRLDPPPADVRVAHPPREIAAALNRQETATPAPESNP
jgi:hypothetical protein